MCWKLCVEPKATKRTPRRYSRCPFVHFDICSTSTACADSRRRCVMNDAHLIRSRDVEQQTRNRGDEPKTTLNRRAVKDRRQELVVTTRRLASDPLVGTKKATYILTEFVSWRCLTKIKLSGFFTIPRSFSFPSYRDLGTPLDGYQLDKSRAAVDPRDKPVARRHQKPVYLQGVKRKNMK